MSDEQKKTFPARKPSAKKRELQSLKKRAINRTNKSMVLTAIKAFKKVLSTGGDVLQSMSKVFSVVDKACKKGVIKKNKANRIKSRMPSKAQQQSA